MSEENATPAMKLAAEVLKAHPELHQIEGFTATIYGAIKQAITDEREGCAITAESFDDGQTSNKPEHSTEVHAVKFTIKAMAHNVASRIRERPKP